MKFVIKRLRVLLVICSVLAIGIQGLSGQNFSNLDYKETCDSSKTGLCYWDLSWGGQGCVQPAIIDQRPCMQIASSNANAVGFAEQHSLYNSQDELTIITISASIKADQIIGKGAGLNIGLYDESGNLIANKDMGGYYSLDWIQSTQDWTKHSISLVAPIETCSMKIGAILYGSGSVFFANYEVSIHPIGNRQPSPRAIDYLDAACDTIQMHSLVRDSINIEELKQTALKIAGPAEQFSDCYLAVQYLLESLRPFGDDHSFFMSEAEVKNWESEGSVTSQIVFPSFKRLDSFGYILVPPFHGGNQEQILAFADSLQNGIRELYRLGIQGWIVDLRENTGGNMAPMIAGLGPLFSVTRLGSLIDVNGKPDSWYYEKGTYYWSTDPGWSVSNPVILDKKLPIAVLTNGQTGSSGEAVVVSFIGNEKTRIFGQPTWGLTTGNGNFQLPDGAEIFLASTIYADRNGKTYYSSIVPNVIIDDPSSQEDDAVIRQAMTWILSILQT